MLNISFIKKNKKYIIKCLKYRKFNNIRLLDNLIYLEIKKKYINNILNKLLFSFNKFNKDYINNKIILRKIKSKILILKNKIKNIINYLYSNLIKIPNIIICKSNLNEDIIIYKYGVIPILKSYYLPH